MTATSEAAAAETEIVKEELELADEDVEDKENGDEKMEEVEEAPKGYDFSEHYKSAKAIDVGRCVLICGLPTSLLDDDFEVFCETLVLILSDDFGVAKDSVESIARLSKDESASEEDKACRAMIAFKSRVHKHRIFAVKKRAETNLALEHLEKGIPAELIELLGDGEDETMEEGEEAKKEPEGEDDKKEGEEEKKKKKEEKQPFRDEHSERPFTLCWDGAPEFQWRLVDAPGDAKKLVIENADAVDIYEPFLYRTVVKAEQIQMRMPGRVVDDQPTALHYGTITLSFGADYLVMQQAMLNLIYLRTHGNRRLKIFLPQTKNNLLRKKEFESRLGRKIDYTPNMFEILVKADDVSLTEATFGLDEAKAAFPKHSVVAVEKVEDANGRACFVVRFASPQETVMAHAYTKKIKLGEIDCRIYLMGAECAPGDESRVDKYLTRMEKVKLSKEKNERKRKERDDAIAKGEIPAKKAKISAPAASIRGARGGRGGLVGRGGVAGRGGVVGRGAMAGRGGVVGRGGTRGAFNGGVAPFKSPTGFSRSAFARDDPSPRVDRASAWRAPPRGGGPLNPFKTPDRRQIDDMVREQRRQLEMQEQLIRQQQVISAMAERLRERDTPALSSSAFRDSSYDRSSSYSSPSSAAYNKASSYTPSPAYEPLSSSYTPSHLSNSASARPFDDLGRGSSSSYSSGYGKPSSYNSASSSSYSRDRRY